MHGALKMAKQKKSVAYRITGAVLLLLFLLGGGYYIAVMSEGSAQQIGAGKDYERLSRNSETYNSRVESEEGKSAFFDKNDISNMQASGRSVEDMNNELLRSGIRKEAKENLKKGSSVSMASSVASERINNPNVDFFESGTPSGTSNSGGSAVSGHVSGGGFQSGRTGAKIVAGGKSYDDKGLPSDAESGLLGALKGALRNSLFGSRTASKDAAKDWVAKNFDGNAETGYAVQYDEGMRAALDYMDPNILPQFLREQEEDPDSGKKVSNSKVDDVGTMDITEYDAEEHPQDGAVAADNEPYSGFYKAVDIMLPGMMNPIFTGFVPRYEKPVKSPYEISRSNLSSGRPSDLPTMNAIDDEELIVYGSKKGFQMVYDMQGNFIGCMDNKTHFFKIAGTPGCPR